MKVDSEQFNRFLKKCNKKQITFINTYLKTLSRDEAALTAGISSKQTYKFFRKLLPYIQYMLDRYGCPISKTFITQKWLELLQQGNEITKIQVLKQLSKLHGLTEEKTTVNVSVPSIQVNFND